MAHDEKAIARYERISRLSDVGEAGRARARRALENAQNRKLRAAWKTNPDIPGALRILGARDEQRVRELLRDDFNLDFDSELPETGRVPTFRCADALRRAGILHAQGRIDEKAFKARVRQARGWDQRYYARLDAVTITPVIVMPQEDREEFERVFGPPQ